jgi:hypothetical protein
MGIGRRGKVGVSYPKSGLYGSTNVGLLRSKGEASHRN